MKLNLVFALAAVLAAAPMTPSVAADAKAKDEAAETPAGPTPEQLKARKSKKPSYAKYAEARAVAEKAGLPLVVAIFPDGNQIATFLKQKVMNQKAFMKDFAAKNCVVAFMRVKQDNKDPKKIETRSMKEADLKFLENFAVSKHDIARAKQANKPEPTYKDMSLYPNVIMIDPNADKELFRFPKYDKEGGFGVWLSQVVDNFRSAGIEPTISPLVQKIIDNPDDPKKWK